MPKKYFFIIVQRRYSSTKITDRKNIGLKAAAKKINIVTKTKARGAIIWKIKCSKPISHGTSKTLIISGIGKTKVL